MEFYVDRVEEVTTEPESEEADEKLYMNRLLMLGRVGGPSTPLHTPPRTVSHCGLSPEIGLLSQRGIRCPADNSQITGDPLTDLLNQTNTVCRGDERSTNMGISKRSGEAEAMTSKSRRLYTHANQPQPNPVSSVQRSKPLSTRSLSQGACSKSSAECIKRSVRKHAPGTSRTKKDNGRISKRSRLGCKNSSSGRGETVKGAVESHLSMRGNCGKTLNKTSGKRKVLRLQSIQKRNKFGETCLHLAVMKGDLQSVKEMIEVGASVNTADHAGWTPLHEAVLGHHYTVAETLIKAGALVNSVGLEGVTPLQDGIQIGDFKLVHLLLKHGADPLMKNHKGKNAIDLNQDSNIEKLLRRFAAKPCRRARQSATIDADENQQTSEAEVCPALCPDPKDVSKENETSSANPEAISSAQHFPQLRDPTKVSDNDGSLPVQEREPPGSDTASCPDSEPDSDITVDYTETRSPSPEHWALCATQDFSGATER